MRQDEWLLNDLDDAPARSSTTPTWSAVPTRWWSARRISPRTWWSSRNAAPVPLWNSHQ